MLYGNDKYHLHIILHSVATNNTRSEKIISEEKMTELHGYTTPMQHPNETIVPETFSLEQTVNLIRKTANI